MVGALPISRSAKPSATASRVQWACRGCPSLMQFPPGAAGEIENVSHTLQPSARCEAATYWYRTGLTMDSTIVRAISADSSKSNHPAGVTTKRLGRFELHAKLDLGRLLTGKSAGWHPSEVGPCRWQPDDKNHAEGYRCGGKILYRGIISAAFPRSIACKSVALNRPTSRRPAAVAFAVKNGKSVPNTICVGFTSLVSDASGCMVMALAVS